MSKIKLLKWYIIGGSFGAIIGFCYWYFYGCINGCAITGSALNSTLYFAFMGSLIPGMIKNKKVIEIPNK
jgi:hypothetical protein